MAKKEENLAKQPEANLAIPSDELDEMFGESTVDTSTGLSFNIVSIMRESAQFEVAPDEYVKTITGYVLYKHRAAQWWERAFEDRQEGDDPRPQCYSLDGITPCGGEQMQAEACAGCEQDKFGSCAREGSKSKACRNTIKILFLQDGAIIPVILSAPPTSLSRKGPLQQWLNAVPNQVSAAYEAIGQRTKKGTPIVDYYWAHVEMSLEKKEFAGDTMASILAIKTLDVVTPKTDVTTLRRVFGAMRTFKELYLEEQRSYIESEAVEPDDVVVDNNVEDDVPI